jgi:hypothetical protein
VTGGRCHRGREGGARGGRAPGREGGALGRTLGVLAGQVPPDAERKHLGQMQGPACRATVMETEVADRTATALVQDVGVQRPDRGAEGGAHPDRVGTRLHAARDDHADRHLPVVGTVRGTGPLLPAPNRISASTASRSAASRPAAATVEAPDEEARVIGETAFVGSRTCRASGRTSGTPTVGSSSTRPFRAQGVFSVFMMTYGRSATPIARLRRPEDLSRCGERPGHPAHESRGRLHGPGPRTGSRGRRRQTAASKAARAGTRIGPDDGVRRRNRKALIRQTLNR